MYSIFRDYKSKMSCFVKIDANKYFVYDYINNPINPFMIVTLNVDFIKIILMQTKMIL